MHLSLRQGASLGRPFGRQPIFTPKNKEEVAAVVRQAYLDGNNLTTKEVIAKIKAIIEENRVKSGRGVVHDREKGLSKKTIANLASDIKANAKTKGTIYIDTFKLDLTLYLYLL